MGTAVFLAAGVMAFGAGCLARSRYERDCLVTEEYRIVSEKIHGPEKTIVFLTDLHNKEFGDQNCRLLDAVRKVKPDAVLSGGDGMVAKKGNSDVEMPWHFAINASSSSRQHSLIISAVSPSRLIRSNAALLIFR